jgi:membrane protease subunit (stomatin/prohibitin family)
MSRVAAFIATAVVLSIVGAQASQQGQTALLRWKQMDVCAKQAQAAFPENNSEANTKRDAKLKECLNANGLPPREPFSTPQPR